MLRRDEMTDIICKTAEELFGIRADPDDAEKLRKHIFEKYGPVNQENIKKVFLSGEAADFLTVNETYFFREPVHFSFLLEMLPAFEETGLRICSAATSTGCEAYSIAMVIEAYNRGRVKPLSYHIDAFDINHDVIKIASAGLYSERSMREDGSSLRYMADPYIKKTEHGYQVDLSLKKNINFFVHNFLNPIHPDTYHFIFFRNAFIYLSPRARIQVLSNLSGALKQDGILFMGVSETAGAHHADLEEKNRDFLFYFQKSSIMSAPAH